MASRKRMRNSSSPDRLARALSSTLAIIWALAAVGAAAQDTSQQSLDDLIPDSAVENPEDWAEQGANGAPAEDPDFEMPAAEIDLSEPLADLPAIELPWPDDLEVEQLVELEPETDIEVAQFEDPLAPAEILPDGDEEVLSRGLTIVFPTERTLFPERDEFLERFKALSTVEELDDDSDSIAKLAARAREDQELLARLLRIYGYYDGQVIREVGAIQPGQDGAIESAGDGEVRFAVMPGRRYNFGLIDLGELDQAQADYSELRSTFAIQSGDPIQQDRIVEQQYALDEKLGESGYPFATIDAPELLIDHAREEGDLTLNVQPGGKYRFGQIRSSMPEFLSGDHFEDIARFEDGDIFKRSDELDLRRAILATGLVSSVSITPTIVEEAQPGEPGTVDLAVDVTEAPLRTIAGSIGFGTGEGFRLAGSWEHRNFFPPEGMIRLRGVAGTREQLAGITFRRNNFKGRDRILTLDAFASTIERDAFEARTVAFLASYERVSTLLFQKPLTWGIGLELVATGEREEQVDGTLGPRETYFVAALPMKAQIDTTDDLLDPTNGWRLGGRVSPEYSVREDDVDGYRQSQYVRGEVEGSVYVPMNEKVVLAGRAKFASIPGAEVGEIAPSRRLYAGGGSSVRGYGYQAIGPRNDAGDPSGGRSLVELSAEARIRTGFLDGAVSVVPFVDAGSVSTGSTPSFDEIQIGAGIGVRYHTGFGPIRVDVGVPLNPGPDDEAFGVYVSLGQAF